MLSLTALGGATYVPPTITKEMLILRDLNAVYKANGVHPNSVDFIFIKAIEDDRALDYRAPEYKTVTPALNKKGEPIAGLTAVFKFVHALPQQRMFT